MAAAAMRLGWSALGISTVHGVTSPDIVFGTFIADCMEVGYLKRYPLRARK
jgi:hypothetical protein